MDALLIAILGIVVIVVATAIAPRVRIAGPLILVAIGIGVSLLPFVPAMQIDPEIILVGVLPPLLYSAAVNVPAIEFRRDFGAIAGLSVVLVVVSSVVLALFFMAVVPGLGFFLALALGAILSPTDAVATTIAKRLGIAPRVVTMLEGESLLNDATSLVILRTSIAAVGVGGAAGEFVGAFAWGVLVALVIGGIVGYVNLRLRALIGDPGANTALGFVVPFAAYLPTEHLGGSGLVAAVVAGIVTGQGAARWFTPEQRLSDRLNWRTVELVLEGGVFLVMGLEVKDLLIANSRDHQGLWHAVWLAAVALAIVLAVRAGYVSVLIVIQRRRANDRRAARLDDVDRRLEAGRAGPGGGRAFSDRGLRAVRERIARARSDLDYYRSSPLDWRHGTVIVWAGMRGVVTLAAAQTLPSETAERPLLVLVAFLVAVGGLMLQGFTLPRVVAKVGLEGSGDEGPSRAEMSTLDESLREAASSAIRAGGLARRDGSAFSSDLLDRVGSRLTQPPDDDVTALARDVLELRLALIEVMRERLREVSRGGGFSTAALRHALAELDADQLSLELRLAGED